MLCICFSQVFAGDPGFRDSDSPELVLQETVGLGIVTDTEGNPLPGVNITIKGTMIGIISDVDGNFSISAGTDDVLVFSYVGMRSVEVPVGNQTTINAILKSAATPVIRELSAYMVGDEKEYDKLNRDTDSFGNAWGTGESKRYMELKKLGVLSDYMQEKGEYRADLSGAIDLPG